MRIRETSMVKRGAVFFDRDGVLNEDSGYVGKVEQFRWLAGVKESISQINRSGLYVFVVTNQSGIARGMYTEEAVHQIHEFMQKDLRNLNAWIDDFRYCPHYANGSVEIYSIHCECRKPKPGMLLDLIDAWNVDTARSIMIGDSVRDVLAGEAAGVVGHLHNTTESLNEVIKRFLEGSNM